jgi:uncharacterized membrane protein
VVLAGFVLAVIGLVITMPTSGSPRPARTIIRQGAHMWQTRSAQADEVRPWWRTVLSTLIGLALICIGLWLIVRGSDNESV